MFYNQTEEKSMMKDIYIVIYSHTYIFLHIDHLQAVHSKVKSGYFGVVEIFMSFLYSTGFRKGERKGDRQESRQALWQWGVGEDSCVRA